MVTAVGCRSGWEPHWARCLILPLGLLQESPTLVVLNWGHFCPQETLAVSADIFGCYSWGGGGVILASSGHRPLQCIGQPPHQKTVLVPRLRNHDGICWELVVDREAWCAAIHGAPKFGHDWASELNWSRPHLYVTFQVICGIYRQT